MPNFKLPKRLITITIKLSLDFAKSYWYDLGRIAKSLFVRCQKRDIYAVVVCSVNKNIDFKLVANKLESLHIEVAEKRELQDKIGHPPNGVSPIGIGNIPIFMDKKLMQFDIILVGQGK